VAREGQGGPSRSRHLGLGEIVAWFESSRLRYTRVRFVLWLAESIFAEVIALARSLIEDALETSRTTGYLHFEGLGCWLMSECLAPESPAMAEPYLKTAIAILQRIGARNDLARAMMTRAALRQAGDDVVARQQPGQADTIFRERGTLDEPARVEAARAALDRGAPTHLSAAGGQ